MRRVYERVSLTEARRRLTTFRSSIRDPERVFKASSLADIIWPTNDFISSQGAGAAASRVLKSIDAKWVWDSKRNVWGWSLSCLDHV